MTEIEILNKKIGDEYITLDGHKIFRLVWSESIFENRHGTFREFTEGGLFIREVTETRKVRKYNYIHNRWVFEMWAPGDVVRNPETPDAINGDYVPVYVFESRDGNYLPPNEKVIRFLIAALHGRVRKDEIPSQEYLEEKEIQHSVEMMDDHPAWFQTRPGLTRNAIGYTGTPPTWMHRKATFFNEGAIDMVERQAMSEAREKMRKEEKAKEIEIEKVKEAVRAREIREATMERETARRERHEPVVSKSPMHKGKV